jgi:hypothetical protein
VVGLELEGGDGGSSFADFTDDVFFMTSSLSGSDAFVLVLGGGVPASVEVE